jgi:nucleoside phosphorylase
MSVVKDSIISEKMTVRLSQADARRMLAEMLRSTLPDRGQGAEIEVELVPTPTFDMCDVGIVIALKEEFAQIFPKISCEHVFRKNVSQHYYIFERSTRNGKYRCVVTFIGGMGLSKAAIVGDRLIQEFSPHTVVNIGIAGAMDDEVMVGDVVVAEQSEDYLASSKAVRRRRGRTFDFALSGDPYKTTDAFVKHADNIPFAHADAFARMMEECCANRGGLIPPAKCAQLQKRNIIRSEPHILTGRVASGSTVGAEEMFVKWLRSRSDRKYLALEMESAGVLASAHSRGTQTLIIRGISDFSDKRKKLFDKAGAGMLRRYAMNNAIALLWQYLELELLERSH